MAIRPTKHDSGKVQSLPVTASTALTKHNLVKMSSGYLVAGAAGDNEVEYLALETVTGGSNDGDVECAVLPIDDTTEFEALVSTTPVQATHVGNDYDLTDATTINLGATTDKVFHIDRISDSANNLVIGRFNKPALA